MNPDEPTPTGEAAGQPSPDITYDVLIVGGGPAGTSAAIYTVRAGLSTLIVDKGTNNGALAMSTKIANYPGIPETITGAELLRRIHDQALGFGAQLVQDRVLSAELTVDPKVLWTTQGLYRGRAVVIATGSMGRTQTVPGEERLLGRGVSYCATCDGAFCRGEEVAVTGHSTEALEEALLLTRWANRVHLLPPTPDFRAPQPLVTEVLEHPKIEVHPPSRVLEIVGDKAVTGLRMAPRGDGERTLTVTGVFIYTQGNRPITDFVKGQLEINSLGCIAVDESRQTSVPGVFAVGDVLCTHLRQAVIAAADGAIAGMAVERYLSGRAKLRPDWG
jgi:thioredoxin reductase (NADPH)